jgi:hypothetical protein
MAATARGRDRFYALEDSLQGSDARAGFRHNQRTNRAARRAIKNRSLEVKDHKNRTLAERQEILDAISSLAYWETFTARGEFKGLPVRSAARAANFDESQE